MKTQTPILQVAIPTPLRRTFDYLPLLADEPIDWQVGQRVKVPFGRREVVGIIIGLADSSEFPANKLKSVLAQIDQTALIDEKKLSLYHWASDYYCHPIGDVILGTLPKKLRQGQVAELPAIETEKKIEKIEKSLPAFKLTSAQNKVVDEINKAKTFQTFLLAGVTGSGKTEIYHRVIANVLSQEKQALVLVPEISLTPQTVTRFEARFNVPILLMHSGLGDKARMNAWLLAAKKTPCIVIGTRSAVFASLPNLGIVIVDEEHDLSFKQQSGFHYSARDIAVMRGKLADVSVVLGTATPSIESWHNVSQKKYQLLKLPERVGKANLPSITLHNICGEKLQNGLSLKLIQAMQKHLKAGNQVLLFLNRRGYAPVLMCHHCGWLAQCPHCDAKLTAHAYPKRLMCHHCGYQRLMIRVCESCQQSEVIVLGLGTEQLEETLGALFPDKKVLRFDRDNVRTFKSLKDHLSQVHNQAVDILIGTQMLVKGHHFENVTLVGAIDVDSGLFSADFRAIERMGQLLTQVAGRAGRVDKSGEVFVQTHHPDHPYLKLLFEKDYFAFIDAILQERQTTQLPPYVHMAVLRAEAKTQSKVMQFLSQAKSQLEKINDYVALLGPLPSTMARKAGVYRAHLLIESPHRSALKKVLAGFMLSLQQQKQRTTVRWILDVDPMEVV